MNNQTKNVIHPMTIGSLVTRFLTSFIILSFTSFFTPTIEATAFFTLFVASIIITILDYLVNAVIGLNNSKIAKGAIAFTVCYTILYFTQFFISGFTISIFSTTIGALIYGFTASIV